MPTPSTPAPHAVNRSQSLEDNSPPGSWTEVTDAFEADTLDANLYKENQSAKKSQRALSDAVVTEDARRRTAADELARWAE